MILKFNKESKSSRQLVVLACVFALATLFAPLAKGASPAKPTVLGQKAVALSSKGATSASGKTQGGIEISLPENVKSKVGRSVLVKVRVRSTDRDARSMAITATPEEGLRQTGAAQPKVLHLIRRGFFRTVAFEFVADEPGEYLVHFQATRSIGSQTDSRVESVLVIITE